MTPPRVDTLRVVAEIGAFEGEGPDVFGVVSGVFGGAEGRIYVADAQASEVRVFEPDGSFAFTVGGQGEGPGEFASPCCLNRGPDGRLWVRDRGNARYSAFLVGEDGAEFSESLKMAHGDLYHAAPPTFQDGRLGDVGISMQEERRVVRHWLDADASVVEREEVRPATPEELGGETVEGEVDGRRVRSYLWPPFGARDLRAWGPEGMRLSGLSSDYRLELIRPDTTIVLRSSHLSPALSPREVGLAEEALQRDAERVGSTVTALPFGVPDQKAALHAAWFDAEGNVWVELSVLDGDPRMADVWSRNGELLRRVVWPAEVRLSPGHGWMEGGRAIGVRRDELGVSYVVSLVVDDGSGPLP